MSLEILSADDDEQGPTRQEGKDEFLATDRERFHIFWGFARPRLVRTWQGRSPRWWRPRSLPSGRAWACGSPMAAPSAPTGSATGDAVEALACAARAACLRLGQPGEPWAMVNSLTAGRLLAASLAKT